VNDLKFLAMLVLSAACAGGCQQPAAPSRVLDSAATTLTTVAVPGSPQTLDAVPAVDPVPGPVPQPDCGTLATQRAGLTWAENLHDLTITNQTGCDHNVVLLTFVMKGPHDLHGQILVSVVGARIAVGQSATLFGKAPDCGFFQSDVYFGLTVDDVTSGRAQINPDGESTINVVDYRHGDTGLGCTPPPQTDCLESLSAGSVVAEGGRLMGTVTLKPGSSAQLITVSSYTTPIFGYSLPQDIVPGWDTQTIGPAPGVYHFSASLPGGFFQGDMYCGPHVDHFDVQHPAFPESDLIACTFGTGEQPADDTHCHAGLFPTLRALR
jgi:hypothetical protein